MKKTHCLDRIERNILIGIIISGILWVFTMSTLYFSNEAVLQTVPMLFVMLAACIIIIAPILVIMGIVFLLVYSLFIKRIKKKKYEASREEISMLSKDFKKIYMKLLDNEFLFTLIETGEINCEACIDENNNVICNVSISNIVYPEGEHLNFSRHFVVKE